MQATPQPTQAPTLPTPPSPPAAAAPAAAFPGGAPAVGADAAPAAATAPRTAAELAGLQARATELRSQLRDVQRQSRDLAREMRHADAGVRLGLQQAAQMNDARAAQLRADIASAEQLVASAPPGVAATVQPRREFRLLGPNGPSPNAAPLLLLVVVLLQILLLARGRARRAAPFASEALLRESAARLARVEQAVDAIAVEVERVSEGQRFVTRVLGDRSPDAARLAAAPREHSTPM